MQGRVCLCASRFARRGTSALDSDVIGAGGLVKAGLIDGEKKPARYRGLVVHKIADEKGTGCFYRADAANERSAAGGIRR